MECSWTAHTAHGVLMECLWSAHGLHVECSWTPYRVLILLMECSWSAHGVHGKVWGSVKYSQSVTVTHTQVLTASNKHLATYRWANRPQYAQNLIWADVVSNHTTLAVWTESPLPLPSLPANELSNSVALTTIHSNPHLFKIITPIDVDSLECLLTSHPNNPFVQSVCQGFHEGF